MTYQPKSEFLQAMQSRGFVDDCTDLNGLDKTLCNQTVTAYIGFDATAKSLHVGSLIQIMMLRWLQKTGHKPVVLMGGGTTKIGDPSFRASERPLLSELKIEQNITSIHKIFERYLKFGDGETDAVIFNNAEWLDKLNYLVFLRDIGRHFSVNRMLSFESVKSRLDRQQSLSFLEFNYMLLQSYDFLVLNQKLGCCLQIGGSDQWGNIVSGVDLTRRIEAKNVYGLTSPLLTTASGAKMGKSTGGAVWLNPNLLSPYEFWQFWRNVEDADVGKFLALFTELDVSTCNRLGAAKDIAINEAKAILADEVTALAHGKDAAIEARQTAASLFGNGNQPVTSAIPELVVNEQDLTNGITIIQALVKTGLAESGKAARRLIANGTVKLNGKTIADAATQITLSDLNQTAILAASRKRHASLRLEN